MLIDQAAHVRQLFFDLEVALLDEFTLEIVQDGQSCLECVYLTVKYEVIPYAARYLPIDILHEDSDEPISQEEGSVDLEGQEVLAQFGQHLLEVAVEQVDSKFDVLDVPSEELDEELFVDEVREANECIRFTAVDQKGASEKAHVLEQSGG